uniref:Lysophosphatidylserine lipase ABHD12 n=1 Tax=Heterorhabditis bacteriophora TaxID=37862 RepID=A0A1I7XLN9_HETBA
MTDYDNVSANGVTSIGRSFYLDGDMGKIGVWHMLPESLSAMYREKGIHPLDEDMEEAIGTEKYPVVLYAHGNSFDRTISHRRELYNVLNDMDYHVIAFDYRGYGDSEGSPTEEGIVSDTRLVYDYVKERIGNNSLIVWGHSMGTGVSTKLVMDLSCEERAPDGLILEAPFNNLHDVVMHHPFSLPIRWWPEAIIESIILDPLRSVGLIMDSDKRIIHIKCPILIMHAADDHVIPAKLGRMLKDVASAANRDVSYFEFDSNRGFQHKFIYLAEELKTIVREFVLKCERIKH